MAKVKVYKDGEAASIRYLHNQMGQRVFKGEPTAEQTLPDETALGTSFIDWLKKNFSWLYAAAQANTSIGTAYVYGGDNEIPAWALLGEYDNGSSKGAGRTEYIWMPTEDGSATPIGIYRGGQFYALHTDHLGTPRLMTNEANKPVWQWPYSAFGSNKPTGILKATANPKAAITNRPVLLQATAAPEMNLGFPGQMRDVETGAFYNALRDAYDPLTGRYRQSDPISLGGGLNRFNYVGGRPVDQIDPTGQFAVPLFTGVIGAVAGGLGNYLVQRFYQDKCEVDWRDVANAATWGGLAGAALPFVGTSAAGAAALGAGAGLGQYATSMLWNSDGPTSSGAIWSAVTGAAGGLIGGTFTRTTWYGASATAMPELARKNQATAAMAANAGVSNGFRNGAAGVAGSLPQESASSSCTCTR